MVSILGAFNLISSHNFHLPVTMLIQESALAIGALSDLYAFIVPRKILPPYSYSSLVISKSVAQKQ